MNIQNFIYCILLSFISITFHPVLCKSLISINEAKITSHSPPVKEIVRRVSNDEVIIDLNNTISEVQRLISLDPRLPRLSHEQILEIIDNITKTDALKEQNSLETSESRYNSILPENKKRDERQQAIMYVLPYSPQNTSAENMEALYTKPPMVQVVGNTTTQSVTPASVNEKKQYSAREPSSNRIRKPIYRDPNRQYIKRNITLQNKPNITPVESTVIGQSNNKVNKTTVFSLQSNQTRPTKYRQTYTEKKLATTERPSVSANVETEEKDLQSNQARPTNYRQTHTEKKLVTTVRPSVSANVGKEEKDIQSNQARPTNYRQTYTEKKLASTIRPTTAANIEEEENYPPEFLKKLKSGEIQAKTSTTRRPYRGPVRGNVRYPNHRYPEEDKLRKPSNQVMQIVNPPKFISGDKKQQINSTFNRYTNVGSIRRPAPFNQQNNKQSSVYSSSTSTVTPPPFKPISTPNKNASALDLQVYNDVKQNIVTDSGTKPTPIKQKYTSSSSAHTNNVKFSSQYNGSPVTRPISSTPIRDNVKQMLASIGLFPVNKANLITTTTTIKPDISNVVDGLDPEMRELLMSFGLIQDPNEVKSKKSNKKEEVDEPGKLVDNPADYASFKPLPDSAPTREDMSSLLESFGITSGANKQRDQKAVQSGRNKPKPLKDVPPVETDMLPGTMIDLLEDIGVIKSERPNLSRMIRNEPLKKNQEKSHVFNPDTVFASNEELQKLDQLLQTIKKIEKSNGTITPSDLSPADLKNIKDLTESLTQTTQKSTTLDQDEDGLNPASLEELQNIFKVKSNKRQSTNSSSTLVSNFTIVQAVTEKAIVVETATSSTSSTTTSTSTVSTTTEEARNPSVEDLADSFGGTTDVRDEPIPDEALPPPRRNGFYFLVDWNSFLEVGEEGKNKVNIRLAPKVGDPSRFINVRVP